MNIKQLQNKLDGLYKNKASLEAKRDAALKVLDDKRAQVKADWDVKIGAVQSEVDKYAKAIKEQEKIEAMLEEARKAADLLGVKDNNEKSI